MACGRGCCATFAEHIRSLHVGASEADKQALRKVTTDVHESQGRISHTVDVTERWTGQDVLVKPRVTPHYAPNKKDPA